MHIRLAVLNNFWCVLAFSFGEVFCVMGKKNRCCVGGCNNDQRYPDLAIKRSHVSELIWHRWPKGEALSELWRKSVSKGRKNFKPGPYMTVCSNHFVDGKRTTENPVPKLFMTESEQHTSSPRKRRKLDRSTAESASVEPDIPPDDVSEDDAETSEDCIYPSFKFAQITRESDVRFFTGIPGTETFKFLFGWLAVKAKHMQYWRGGKQTLEESPKAVPQLPLHSLPNKRGPTRSLTLETEFLLVLMRLRLALLGRDLAFRFKVTPATVSSIFVTWITLMAKELGVLIIWPSRAQVRKTLPNCFRKLYPKVRVVNDCFEVFTETPSALDLAAAMWSEYKHHYTIKVLIGITPTGAISYVSPVYGGRASDVFVVRNSGFLKLIEPYDQVMADRGFKIKEDLMMMMASLCIPPSCAASSQMLPGDIKKTSSIANVRIFVEQAIRRVKTFNMLKNELPITLVSQADNIVKVCCSLCNLLPPLCD